jgi:ankyrin repeat protein
VKTENLFILKLYGHSAIYSLIIENGAYIEVKTTHINFLHQNTPLQPAAFNHHSTDIKENDCSGQTPLHIADEFRRAQCLVSLTYRQKKVTL